MNDFKCIGPNCIDTCCAGWDINIDKNTFKKYENGKGNLKELINGKYLKNSESGDSFNYGFMKITKDNKCPFLNDNLLCEIHGKCGEESLSITCRRYPRVFNIIDDIYEKSGLPSCEEICSKAFLNKEKMEFIEIEEELDDEDRIEFLKTNEMSINKLHNLIDSLVNISRLEASMINIKIENKSIKQTLIKAINSTVPKANQKNININIEDFEDIEIPHDTKWTEESIFNVLENAVKYSSENKDINVQVSETINFIRIDIKDNGIGIDKSEYNNIFKRFYRSEKVDDIEGSGIGLYLSRKILEKQGGNIIVSSQKEQGSKFSLFLTKV